MNPFRDDSIRDESFPKIACMMWAVWNSRNSFVHEGKVEKPTSILAEAKAMLPIQHNQSHLLKISIITQTTEISAWIPPPLDWIKINCDRAWDLCSVNGGGMFVIRDSTHQFILAEAIYSSRESAEEAKIRTIKEAMKKSWERKYQQLVIEGDAEGVIQRINQRDFCGNLRTQAVLSDIEFLISKFKKILLTFVNRIYNRVAHRVAQWAKKNHTCIA
ncbi:uncharacterized protein LOC113351120 [Papaver somniferum]|uniref:uncharacterized protein LOC113351120 n=1 Tax=Papaver somniferum TaxID=3469 RepID=UPI000E6FBE2A|nr:uncharacterized protein LOC113351120 [Papaver somniferum]